jgi:hypothetical protein
MRQGESLASVCSADAQRSRQLAVSVQPLDIGSSLLRTPRGVGSDYGSAPVCRIEQPMGSDPAVATLEDIEVQIMDAAPTRRPLSVSTAE